MARRNFTQLPSSKDLVEIMEEEASRDLPKEKLTIHYPSFSTIVNLAKVYDVNPEFFTTFYSEQEMTNSPESLNLGAKTTGLLVERILVNPKAAELNKIYDYLAEEDKPTKTDLTFVFGSSATFRVEKAIELYQQGLVNKLVVSGSSPIYKQEHQQTEADRNKEIAVEAGIPQDKIIIENQSITLPDNIRSSLNLLDKQKVKFKSITLINSPFSQRRGWAVFLKYLPTNVRVYRINSGTSENFSRENWYKQEGTLRIYLNEFVKMKIAVSLNTA